MKKITYAFVFVALLIFACKKETVTPVVVTTDSFGLIQQKIFDTKCATSGCHASTGDSGYKQHNLVLKGTDVYTRILNGTVKNADAVKANLKQIVPNDLDKSFLYQKCNYSKSPYKYGSSMPLGDNDLTVNQLKFIEQWIKAGAPQIGDVADKTLLQ